MKALDIRRRLTEEVNRHPEIPSAIREKFDMERLDEPSGGFAEGSLWGYKFRLELPLRLYRTWFIHPIIDQQWADLFKAFGYSVKADYVGLTPAQGEAFRPIHRLANACVVEDALDRLTKEALGWAGRSFVAFDPNLLFYLPVCPSADPTLGVTEADLEVLESVTTPEEATKDAWDAVAKMAQAWARCAVACVDERAEIPFVEEPDVADALRYTVQNKGAEATTEFFADLVSRRQVDLGTVKLPARVVGELIKEAQSERAIETGGGRPSILLKLGPEAPLIARALRRSKLSLREIARRMGIAKSSVYDLLHAELPPVPPGDEQIRILAERYGFKAADAVQLFQASYRRRKLRQ